MSEYGPPEDVHTRTEPGTGKRHLISMRMQMTLCGRTDWIGWSIYHGHGTAPAPLCPICFNKPPAADQP
jgi:hypothetical protein